MLHDITDLPYLVPRVVLWILLFAVALFDAVRHRHIKRRGNQLQRGIVVSLFAYVVQDILLLAYSVLESGHNKDAIAVRRAYYVFSDLADAVFMGLLLLIASGYCITRDNLGPYRDKVLVTPAVYFVTKAATDLIVDVYEPDGGSDILISDFDAWTFFVLYIAQVVSLMAFMLALVFIFEIVNREVESVTKPRDGIIGARDLEAGPVGGVGVGGARSAAGASEAGQGHNVALPPEATENGQPLSDVYAEVTGEDSDAPKTVEEKLQHRTKVTLMKQFSWAAAVCVACYVVALILPLFYYSQPGEEDTAVLVVLILWNCVRWLFLAGLCFIFRVRETNPYLLLDEEGSGPDDFGSPEVRTELGLLTSSPDRPWAGGEGAGDGVNPTYSLGDEEEEVEERKRPARKAPPVRTKSNID